MHWLHRLGIDPHFALQSAPCHFEAGVETIEKRAVRILSDAGLNAVLHHSGGGTWVAEVRSGSAPGRHVWVTDSEGEEAGPFLIGIYPDSEGVGWFEATTRACSEAQLVTEVRRALAAPPN